MMLNQEYISLVSIEPSKNKWRSYAIQVTTKEDNDDSYQVLCAWGRMNRYQRKLIKNFEAESEMLKFLEALFKRRHKNGYQVVAKSEGFPLSPTLYKIRVTNNIAGQLQLF